MCVFRGGRVLGRAREVAGVISINFPRFSFHLKNPEFKKNYNDFVEKCIISGRSPSTPNIFMLYVKKYGISYLIN
jgi:hypothetical protein